MPPSAASPTTSIGDNAPRPAGIPALALARRRPAGHPPAGAEPGDRRRPARLGSDACCRCCSAATCRLPHARLRAGDPRQGRRSGVDRRDDAARAAVEPDGALLALHAAADPGAAGGGGQPRRVPAGGADRPRRSGARRLCRAARSPPPPARTADARLVPSGEPLGSRADASGIPRREAAAAPARVCAVAAGRRAAEPAPPVAGARARSRQASRRARPSRSPPAPAARSRRPPSRRSSAATTSRRRSSSPRAAVRACRAEPAPVDRAAGAACRRPPSRGRSAAGVRRLLAAAPRPPAPAAGAVDITAISPRREAPRAAAAARAAAQAGPSEPPLGPGRHRARYGALAFDWRRIKREAGGLLDSTAPHVAAWGQTNRLVAGPFASAGRPTSGRQAQGEEGRFLPLHQRAGRRGQAARADDWRRPQSFAHLANRLVEFCPVASCRRLPGQRPRGACAGRDPRDGKS